MTDEEQIEIKHKTEFLQEFFRSLCDTLSIEYLKNYIVITCDSNIAGLKPINNEMTLIQISKKEILTNACNFLDSFNIQYKKCKRGIFIDLYNTDLLCGIIKLYSTEEI